MPKLETQVWLDRCLAALVRIAYLTGGSVDENDLEIYQLAERTVFPPEHREQSSEEG